MHLVVTGAAGFIGRHVQDAAESRGHDVLALRHRWSSPDQLYAFLREAPPVDAVVHLGWYADPQDYLTNVEANAASIASALELGRALLSAGTRSLVVAGTCLEYAMSDDDMEESTPVLPTTPYGSAKAFAHVLLRDLLGQDRALAWARLFYVVGPGQPAGRVYSQAARAVLAGNPIALSDGAQVRDFIDVRDVAAALVRLAEERVDGVFNVCTGQGRSLRELLDEFARAAEADPSLLRFGERPRRPGEAERIVGDPTRLHRETGWQASIPLSATVRDILASEGTAEG